MTKTTQQSTDPDRLEQELAELAERQAAAQARLSEHYTAEQAQMMQQQSSYDRKVVESYSAKALDEAVDQAGENLDAVVAELPITKALANYLAAQVVRYFSYTELMAARGRLGMPANGQLPPAASVGPLDDYINATATRMAHDVLTAQQEQAHRQRNGEVTP